MEDFNVLDDQLGAGEIKLVPARKTKRFQNYLVDVLCLYILIFLFGYFSFLFVNNLDGPLNNLSFNFMGIIGVLAFYVLFEHLSHGKTPGKWITRTRVVTREGKKPTLLNIIGRSAARLIPFEPFSFLGSGAGGWHDTLSKTLVIDEEESDLRKPLV